MRYQRPAPLKWLAERRAGLLHRANVAAESAQDSFDLANRFIRRAEKQAVERQRIQQAYEAAAQVHNERGEKHEIRRHRLQAAIEAVDRSLMLYFQNPTRRLRKAIPRGIRPVSAFVPADIGPTNAWHGHYGKRGVLRDFVLEFLQSRPTVWLNTGEINAEMVRHFAICVYTPREKRRWQSSFKSTLKKLHCDGFIERELRRPGVGGSREALMSKWRWKQHQPKTLEQLREEEELEYA